MAVYLHPSAPPRAQPTATSFSRYFHYKYHGDLSWSGYMTPVLMKSLNHKGCLIQFGLRTLRYDPTLGNVYSHHKFSRTTTMGQFSAYFWRWNISVIVNSCLYRDPQGPEIDFGQPYEVYISKNCSVNSHSHLIHGANTNFEVLAKAFSYFIKDIFGPWCLW